MGSGSARGDTSPVLSPCGEVHRYPWRSRPTLSDNGWCAPMSATAGLVAPAGANAVLAWGCEDCWRNVDDDAGVDVFTPVVGEFVPTPLADAADTPFQGGGLGRDGGCGWRGVEAS